MPDSVTRRGAGALMCSVMIAGAATQQAWAQTDVDAALDGYMRRMATFGFGGQVVAVRAGGVVALNQAYGWADRAERREMTRTTPIGIASASKQFTAAAIMKLAEAGALALDQPIGGYLRDAPPDKAGLTLHHILSHTAGLSPADLGGDFEIESKRDLIARAYAAPLVGAPGQSWRYSNAGYNLVAAIIEAVSGRSYEDFLREVLFAPAGLQNTGFAFHSSFRRKRPAHAYRAWLDQGGPENWPRPNWRPWGGGTVFSTAEDLYRWQQALDSGRVLSATSVERLITPHTHPNPDAPLAYGYGAFVERGENGLLIERSGDWERGYNAAWHRWPEQDLTLIVVANSVTPANASMRQAVQADLESMVRGVALESEPPNAAPLSRSERRRLMGGYVGADGMAMQLINDGAYLWAEAQSQPAVEAMMLTDVPEERRQAYRNATAKTERLLASVSRAAFAEALTAEHVDVLDEYWTEWSGLLDAHGALVGYDVLGTVRAGPAARTVTRLRFERSAVIMQFRWADLGNGRLAGTALNGGAPTPYACVLARADDALVGYDTMSGAQFRASSEGRDRLTIRSASGDIDLVRRH